jgi:hypothetical protein
VLEPVSRPLFVVHKFGTPQDPQALRIQAAFLDPTSMPVLAVYDTSIQTALRQAGARLYGKSRLGVLDRGNLPTLLTLNMDYDPVISQEGMNFQLAQLQARLLPKYSGVASITPSIEFGKHQLLCRATLTLRYGQFQFHPEYPFDNPFVRDLVRLPGRGNTYDIEFTFERPAVIAPEVLDFEFERAADSLGVCLDHFEFDETTRRRVLQLVC